MTRIWSRLLRSVTHPGHPNLFLREGVEDREHLRTFSRPAAPSAETAGRLRHLPAPTLVIPGLDDRMGDVSGGRAAAVAILQAGLVLIPGLGRNLPPGESEREIAGPIADLGSGVG